MTVSRTESSFANLAYTWVVDQVSDESATVEVDGKTFKTVPRWMLPRDVQEGDVLQVQHDHQAGRSVLMIVSDHEERLRRLAQSREQVAQGKETDRPGDVVL
ncbi:MAG TPA: DUF3006 domain-containing protein [Gemmatimonadaceae bacterium]|jgi:hypothetical protein|nr:DUF3006 domain-containing protein [Gemmatimonadaceae bacterium]